MKKMKTEISISSGLLKSQSIPSFCKKISKQIVIITDETVNRLYGEEILGRFRKEDLSPLILTFPEGERSKSRETKKMLEDKMFNANITRDACLIALGGGVTTDLAGFIAATYCRGLPLVLIPTSLLAMVDASIGGKTGIDVPFGKNLLGAFYEPNAIFIDPSVLSTLPKKEALNGLAEVIKHGLIKDAKLIDFLNKNHSKWTEKDIGFLEKIVSKSVDIKQEVVAKDFKEGGLRRILNFGHTIGHALETALEYVISHGEAVAMGMIAEAHLSNALNFLSKKDFEEIYHLIKSFGFSLKIPKKLSLSDLMQPMRLDKKIADKNIRFALISYIGESMPFDEKYCLEVDERIIEKTLKWTLTEFES